MSGAFYHVVIDDHPAQASVSLSQLLVRPGQTTARDVPARGVFASRRATPTLCTFQHTAAAAIDQMSPLGNGYGIVGGFDASSLCFGHVAVDNAHEAATIRSSIAQRRDGTDCVTAAYSADTFNASDASLPCQPHLAGKESAALVV